MASSTVPEAADAVAPLSHEQDALGRRAEDPVGAAAQRPPHALQRLLEGYDGRAAAAEAQADRRRGRPARHGRLWCRVAAQRQGSRCLRADGPGDGEALGLLERLDGAFGAQAEEAVDTAGHVHAGVDQRLLQLLHRLPHGAPGERAGRGRRRCRSRSQAERGGGRLVDDAGDGEPLVALEGLHRRLGGRTEVAVDAVLDADPDAHQRQLERLDGFAIGALLEADDVDGGRRRGRRRQGLRRCDRRRAQGQSRRDQHEGAGATDSGTTRACDRRDGHRAGPPCSCVKGFGRVDDRDEGGTAQRCQRVASPLVSTPPRERGGLSDN